MEDPAGFEPTTPRLTAACSDQTELRIHICPASRAILTCRTYPTSIPEPSNPLCHKNFLTCRQFANLVRVEGLKPPASWPQTTRSTNCATPGYCPCAGFRRRFNRRAAGSIVSPELDRDYCPGHMHAESNCAPVAPALAETSRSRTCLVAQQRGLEPPAPFGAPAFQAGRLPLSHCCMGPRRRG